MKDVKDIMLASFVAVETAHTFSAFNPSIFTIKSLVKAQRREKNIREGYIPAIIFSLLISGIVAKIIKNPLPIFMAILTDAFMIGWYEWALRS